MGLFQKRDLGNISGNCTATYDVTGIVQQMIGRFGDMEVLMRPQQINPDGQDDLVYYRAPALWLTYYP